jgi:hypothetical protein
MTSPLAVIWEVFCREALLAASLPARGPAAGSSRLSVMRALCSLALLAAPGHFLREDFVTSGYSPEVYVLSCLVLAVQLCQEGEKDLSVCVIEKGSQVGEQSSPAVSLTPGHITDDSG